jgi:hypothetical protein
MWPDYRTGLYAIWKACLRVGIRPPGVPQHWDDCGVVAQALILAFDQTCSHEEDERAAQMVGARMPLG